VINLILLECDTSRPWGRPACPERRRREGSSACGLDPLAEVDAGMTASRVIAHHEADSCVPAFLHHRGTLQLSLDYTGVW